MFWSDNTPSELEFKLFVWRKEIDDLAPETEKIILWECVFVYPPKFQIGGVRSQSILSLVPAVGSWFFVWVDGWPSTVNNEATSANSIEELRAQSDIEGTNQLNYT